MKVILVNGSPHPKGTTFEALQEVAKPLIEAGIETEIFHIGNKALQSCQACGHCAGEVNACVFKDSVNEFVEKAKTADGYVFASPVHFAGITGGMKCFLDRVFYSARSSFVYKPCGIVVCARRAGTTAALEQLNKYPLISKMLLVGSQYWTMAFGSKAEDIFEDAEGLQIMRTLGTNLAWVMTALDKADINNPEGEKIQRTNFIRK